MGPNAPRLTVLSAEEEVRIVAFRRLYASQATIQHLTRSSLHRLFRRHAVNRFSQEETAAMVASLGN